jgi:hypothetical protein
MVSYSYPVWAIKRDVRDVEAPVNESGHPGYDHAIWYWWDLKTTVANHYKSVTWDAADFIIRSKNKTLMESPYSKLKWERLSEKTWRLSCITGGNYIVVATLTKGDLIENPESTYRWYKE